ncbi:MAG: DDE-type integrase/transposase/recombinase [Spirochaetia bacterium]|nr:DDE-type integrase/transposase/recombinase [Spirochaetia bacterium]
MPQKKPLSEQVPTDSKHSLLKYPNLLLDPEKRKMPTIVGDVTYYDVRGKNHYCAHLMDLTNREIVGIAISDRLDTNLVCEALRMAIRNRGILKGFIHHTDSDSRYCSQDYIKLLKPTGAEISMCVGNAYENAHSESLNKTLKRQEININQYLTKEESARSIFLFQENTPNSVKPEPKVSPEKIIEFAYLKTPKKKYEPLSVVTG